MVPDAQGLKIVRVDSREHPSYTIPRGGIFRVGPSTATAVALAFVLRSRVAHTTARCSRRKALTRLATHQRRDEIRADAVGWRMFVLPHGHLYSKLGITRPPRLLPAT